MAFYSNGTETIYCPFDEVAKKLLENGWVSVEVETPNTDFNFSVNDLTDKIVPLRTYVNTVTYGLDESDKWKVIPSNIRNGVQLLGVTGTMMPYVAPQGIVRAEYTDNGTYIVDCANKAQVEIVINVPTTGGGTETEEDEDIMTIIPCKVVLDHTQALTSVQFEQGAYADLATVRDSDKPYAVKVKADVYCDLTVAGMGVLYVESMYLNLSSYNSETYSADNINYAVFEGSTAGTTSAFNPMQLTIHCDSDTAELLWFHVVSGAMTADNKQATFDLEV